MASRISQMRNGIPLQPRQQQPLLNKSVEQTRALMQQMRNTSNPEEVIMGLLQNNPELQTIAPMLRNGNSLEGIARQMAQANNINIDDLIKQLQGGI